MQPPTTVSWKSMPDTVRTMGREPCSMAPQKLRRTAIYGRVSTQHEAQLSAFENQQAWYEREASYHDDWVIVARYYDEGVTGTAAQKRPEFMRMLEDAKQHKFDLLVTREVCRFARNTVDALSTTRMLSNLNIEVFFIQDNIWTMSGDGELRLSLMSMLAQEESRKVSERVLAGQSISRKNGTLYGNGNILGYDRKGDTYVINPEQAYSVRKIYELYADGLGYQKICNELMRLGCKNASDKVQWSVDRIGRILRNATYKGYICYNKSHSNNFLEQKRVNHRDEEFVYMKGDFEPIVSEKLWNQCEEIRLRKSAAQRGEDGKTRKFGRREPQSVWSNLLRCSCGSAFARFLWRINEDGKKVYGYECYRQKRSATASYLRKHGLDQSIVCEEKSIPGWHLDLMAYAVFTNVWGDQKEAVLLACQMIEECAVAEQHTASTVTEGLKHKLERLKRQQSGLREMRALGDITREEFQQDNQKLQQDIDALEQQLADSRASQENSEAPINMDRIKATLNQWLDLSGPVIPDALIEQFVLQVVVEDRNVFNWTLNLDFNTTCLIPPSEIARRQYHEKRTDGAIDSMLSKHITNPQKVWGFLITEEHARAYCKEIGQRFFAKKWKDIVLYVSI